MIMYYDTPRNASAREPFLQLKLPGRPGPMGIIYSRDRVINNWRYIRFPSDRIRRRYTETFTILVTNK